MAEKPTLPPSVADNRVGLVGLASALATLLYCIFFANLHPLSVTALLCFAYAAPVIALEVGVRRVHRNPSTGLDWDNPAAPCPRRIVFKITGLALTLFAVVAFHAIFRLYLPDQLTAIIGLTLMALPALIALSILYIAVIDGRMRAPHDAYWELGAMALGKKPVAWTPKIRDHTIGWMVKAFFLPIMISYLVANAGILGQVRHSFMEASIVEFVLMLTIVATIVDLAIGCVGYSLTLRLFDAHIRSPNRYLVAWVVCLACYFPISNVVIGQMFQYRNARDWTDVVTDYPLLMGPWMAAIVGLFAIYLWSKCVFGLRFSNLTHRGIVTNGPYRYTKHPDYVTKSIFFWLTAAPFLTAVDAQAAVTTSAALVAVNLMYWGRARTEEMHLSEDPDYVAYALAMNERSIFRRVPRFIPALRYRAPSGGEAMPAAPAMTPAE